MSMVDVSGKPDICREATASGIIKLKSETVRLVREGKTAKGDSLLTAKISGTLAAKRTSSLIPLCHPLPLTNVEIEIRILDDSRIEVKSTVKAKAQTGVEMEALVAAAVSLLTIWDMVKQYEKDMDGQYPTTSIENIHVVRKIKEERCE